MMSRPGDGNPSQNSDHKSQQKQKPVSLIEEQQSKMQQQQYWQEHDLQYPAQAKQIHAANFEYEQQQWQKLLNQLLAQQSGHGFEGPRHYYQSMTPDEAYAFNCYYNYCRQLLQYYYHQQQQRPQQQQQSLQESSNMNHCRSLTSFLDCENTFLTPWSWNSQAPNIGEKQSMHFQPGSFFSYDIPSQRPKSIQGNPRVQSNHRF